MAHTQINDNMHVITHKLGHVVEYLKRTEAKRLLAAYRNNLPLEELVDLTYAEQDIAVLLTRLDGIINSEEEE